MIISTLQKINAFLLDILFPRSCLNCGRDGTYLCMECAFSAAQEPQISSRVPYLDFVISVEPKPYLRDAIHHFKYYFDKDLACPLGSILREQFWPNFASLDAILVPVPLHKKRYRYRSFNQSELLAQEIGAEVLNAIERVRDTKPQVELSRDKRMKNLKNAFALDPLTVQKIAGRNVVLVDDVCTTGTTLRECAKVLRKAKPKSICGLVITRGC